MTEKYITDEQATFVWMTCQFYKYNLSDEEIDFLTQLLMDGCSWAATAVLAAKRIKLNETSS